MDIIQSYLACSLLFGTDDVDLFFSDPRLYLQNWL